ncbi:DNA pilot protein [Dipodfec virus UA06Rod_22]|uniref:DNA pilot protein n=1 Tax=Dipodfec virus UA06Rod_22 TaxID=2929322 RepID=A0A976N1W9_9VIRU|nr:DNA pilot protein [Dipodfec virus UA06Rod_22]
MNIWNGLQTGIGAAQALGGKISGNTKSVNQGISNVASGLSGQGYYPSFNAGAVSYDSPSAPSTSVSSGSNTSEYLAGLGGLLGGASSIIGGIFNYKQQKKANKEAKRQFNEMLAFQKDQFYNAMQHRVTDAYKSGVHPLAALGVNPHGSASPTAHYQSATGLGNSLQSIGAAVNSGFENAQRAAQLSAIESQIAANKALAIKYSTDAGRNIAETEMTRKELKNYHLYRAWNSVNNTIRSVTGLLPRGSRIGEINNYRDYYMSYPSTRGV